MVKHDNCIKCTKINGKFKTKCRSAIKVLTYKLSDSNIIDITKYNK